MRLEHRTGSPARAVERASPGAGQEALRAHPGSSASPPRHRFATLALHAGSFDPVTLGHLSVVARAARLFERVLVVAVNPNKTPLFSLEERLRLLTDATRPWPNVECTFTEGLVVELARARGASSLVRGVRGATDADAELLLAHQNHALAPEVETVFLPAHPELSEVSSSALKRLAAQGLDVSRYCPPNVAARLAERFGGSAHPEVHP